MQEPHSQNEQEMVKTPVMDPSQTLKGTTFGDYEVGDVLGRGGMAIVYRGRQVSLDRPVAIKVLPTELCGDHEYVDRFLHEARAAAHLNHPNIIQVYDAGVFNDIYFLVMEFVDGKNMGQIVREQGHLSERDALRIVQHVAVGLAFAHSRGIVHRDVKPENIMRTRHGVIKIGDLGLVKWKPNEHDHSLSTDGSTIGTPYYISPEQIRNLKDIDGRADIYSLGMTLYHLLAGRPAFYQGTPTEIMEQHLSGAPPPLLELNPEISQSTLELVSLMTAKEREDRISDMERVSQWIANILGEPAPIITTSASISREDLPPSDKPTRRLIRQIPYLAGAVFAGLFLALLVIAAWKLTRDHRPPNVASPIPLSTPAPSLPKALPTSTATTPPERMAAVPQAAVSAAPTVQAQPLPLNSSPKPVSIPQPSPAPMEIASLSTPVPAPQPAPSIANIEQKISPPMVLHEEVRELVVDRTSAQILEVTISSSPWLMDAMYLRGMSAASESDGRVDPEMMDLIVGRSDRNEFRSLVRLDWDEKQWVKVLQGNSRITSAVLELTPVAYSGKQTTDYLELEVTRIIKSWGNDPARRSLLVPFRYFRALADETNWEWASRSKKIKWNSKGADSSNYDFEGPPFSSATDPSQTSFRFTKTDLKRSLRINILGDLRRLANEFQRTGKLMAHHGWLIRPIRGTGEVRFGSGFGSTRDGPRLVLSVHCGPNEEPLVSNP